MTILFCTLGSVLGFRMPGQIHEKCRCVVLRYLASAMAGFVPTEDDSSELVQQAIERACWMHCRA